MLKISRLSNGLATLNNVVKPKKVGVALALLVGLMFNGVGFAQEAAPAAPAVAPPPPTVVAPPPTVVATIVTLTAVAIGSVVNLAGGGNELTPSDTSGTTSGTV